MTAPVTQTVAPVKLEMTTDDNASHPDGSRRRLDRAVRATQGGDA